MGSGLWVLGLNLTALHEYHVAIFNLYFVAAIGRQLDGAKSDIFVVTILVSRA